jgi:hypothetical protein
MLRMSLPYLQFLILVALLVACGGAGTGTKIEKLDSPPSVTGSCVNGATTTAINIFQENPRTSSGNPSLAFNTTLITGHTVGAALSGLNGNCLLQSDRFQILSDTLYPYNVGTVTSSSLPFAPSQPEFRQFNSFYYATTLRNLMFNLGADLSALGKVSIDANCNISNNAYYSPSSKRVCLGYVNVGGGKKVWAADDADVVIHESGHAINHTLSSTSIMNSSGEAGAIDESIADYWALTVLSDAELSEWFLGALGSQYIRDANLSLLYPDSMNYSIHDDSRVLTQLLWDLRKTANLGKATTDALVKRAMQLLPATTRFKDFYQAFYDASGPAFLNLSGVQRSLIVSKFTAKGLHRVDSAAGLRLSTAGGATKTIYVIDDHSISAQSGGNCNGVLDVGETALVLVNLENPNATRMGMGVATLGAAPAGTQVPSGGQIGEFFRINANSDFVSSMAPSGSNRDDAIIMGAFLISATTSGVKNFTLSFKPMYADPTAVPPAPNPDVSVNFSLTVGTTATSSSCDDLSLWP